MTRPARAPQSPSPSATQTARSGRAPDAAPAEDVSPAADSIATRLSFLVHTISARIALLGNQHFRAHALNHYSARILVLLREKEALRTGELVELMVLPQSTISSQLQVLQKKGLVRRRRSRTDNRSVVVTLTPAGQELADDCNGLSLRANADMLEGIGEEVRQVAFDFLHKVNHTLMALEQQTPLYPFHEPRQLRELVAREKAAPRKRTPVSAPVATPRKTTRTPRTPRP